MCEPMPAQEWLRPGPLGHPRVFVWHVAKRLIRQHRTYMSQRDEYQPGVPCWLDTLQPDPEAAARFYASLFGWEFVGPDHRHLQPGQEHDHDVSAPGLRGWRTRTAGLPRGSSRNDGAGERRPGAALERRLLSRRRRRD